MITMSYTQAGHAAQYKLILCNFGTSALVLTMLTLQQGVAQRSTGRGSLKEGSDL